MVLYQHADHGGMPNGFWIDIWRFIAGIGIGVELVTIDTYVSELIPREERGRASPGASSSPSVLYPSSR